MMDSEAKSSRAERRKDLVLSQELITQLALTAVYPVSKRSKRKPMQKGARAALRMIYPNLERVYVEDDKVYVVIYGRKTRNTQYVCDIPSDRRGQQFDDVLYEEPFGNLERQLATLILQETMEKV